MRHDFLLTLYGMNDWDCHSAVKPQQTKAPR